MITVPERNKGCQVACEMLRRIEIQTRNGMIPKSISNTKVRINDYVNDSLKHGRSMHVCVQVTIPAMKLSCLRLGANAALNRGCEVKALRDR